MTEEIIQAHGKHCSFSFIFGDKVAHFLKKKREHFKRNRARKVVHVTKMYHNAKSI